LLPIFNSSLVQIEIDSILKLNWQSDTMKIFHHFLLVEVIYRYVVGVCRGYVVGEIKIKAKLSPAGAGTWAELSKALLISKVFKCFL
jgi:hypothetical protein